MILYIFLNYLKFPNFILNLQKGAIFEDLSNQILRHKIMPTVLDVLKAKGPDNIFYTDIRKLDGTALHIWKQREKEFLSKKEQSFGDKKMMLIEFPERFLGTIESVMKYHFEKKEKNIEKAEEAIETKRKRLEQKKKKAENKFRKDPQDTSLTNAEIPASEKPKKRKRKRIIRKVVRKIENPDEK